MKVNEAKRTDLEKQRDDLLQQVKEKQNVIESLMKVNSFFYSVTLFSDLSKEEIRLNTLRI